MYTYMQSYEKRFFRTFEDAMQPPPKFRRSTIATKKPGLPVPGWSNCFHKDFENLHLESGMYSFNRF